MDNDYDISIVSPVYNEEEVVAKFFARISEVLDNRKLSYEIVFVDDGSSDGSFEILRGIQAESSSKVKVVKLARNFGHQLAITAGMREAHGLMWGEVSATAALGTVPILILAIILQKYLVRGLSLGSFR